VRTCAPGALALVERGARKLTPRDGAHGAVLMAIERGKLQDLVCERVACSSSSGVLLLQVRVRGGAMRITSKGQVTIPVEIREKAGLLPRTEVEFELDGKGVRIRRAKVPRREGRGAAAVDRLRGRATVKMSTDEIMALTRQH
jgi:AbrB family looped-hinge helix DNA binding protein